jgi:hypothetical protein
MHVSQHSNTLCHSQAHYPTLCHSQAHYPDAKREVHDDKIFMASHVRPLTHLNTSEYQLEWVILPFVYAGFQALKFRQDPQDNRSDSNIVTLSLSRLVNFWFDHSMAIYMKKMNSFHSFRFITLHCTAFHRF